jgi:hypothetical protein
MFRDEMEKEALEKVNQAIYRQFPYLQGIEPIISQIEKDQFLMVYKGSSHTADGHSLPISIRIITDTKGKIKKITSSR